MLIGYLSSMQTSGLIQRNKFESVCQELSNALQREHQAQQLLNEQSSQLEELSMRLNMHTAEELEKNATISEAVKVSNVFLFSSLFLFVCLFVCLFMFNSLCNSLPVPRHTTLNNYWKQLVGHDIM